MSNNTTLHIRPRPPPINMSNTETPSTPPSGPSYGSPPTGPPPHSGSGVCRTRGGHRSRSSTHNSGRNSDYGGYPMSSRPPQTPPGKPDGYQHHGRRDYQGPPPARNQHIRDRTRQITRRLDVDDTDVGFVIGKGGATVKRIKAQSGAGIKHFKSSTDDRGERVRGYFSIRGSEYQIHNAMLDIYELVVESKRRAVADLQSHRNEFAGVTPHHNEFVPKSPEYSNE